MDPVTVIVNWMRNHGTTEDVALTAGKKRRSRLPVNTDYHPYVIQVLVNDGNLRTKNEEERNKHLLGLLQLADFPLLVSAPARFDEVGRSTYKNSFMQNAYGQWYT